MKPKLKSRIDTRDKINKINKEEAKAVIEIKNIKVLPNELLSAMAKFTPAITGFLHLYVLESLTELKKTNNNSTIIKQGNKALDILNKLMENDNARSNTATSRTNRPVSGVHNTIANDQNASRSSMARSSKRR